MAKSPSFPGTMTDAIILHARLRLPLSCPAWQEPLLQALPYAQRLKLERREPEARRASLAGLGLVLVGAVRVTQREFPPQAFTFPPAGKPRLAGGPHFSISHSSSAVTCIVCTDTDCGIDIEDRPDPAESATLAKLQRWTATEAALKAAGLGLRAAGEVALADRLGHAIVRSQRYELQALEHVSDVIGHIAARQKLTPIIASLELDDARTSALLERSFGLAAQIE
jgi:phosphopantetheinyl transferase